MAEFKGYLETRGATLAQSPEFACYFALPFIPDPSQHVVFKRLFMVWSWLWGHIFYHFSIMSRQQLLYVPLTCSMCSFLLCGRIPGQLRSRVAWFSFSV